MKIQKIAQGAVAVALGAILALPVPGTAEAEGLRLSGSSSKSRAEQFARQTRLMDSRLAGQYQQSARLQPGANNKSVVTIELSPNIPAYRGKRST